jgi:hypothetical protein
LKHRWKQQRWWTRVLSIIPVSGSTKTCQRCGGKLRTTKAPSLMRRGTFTSRYEYFESPMLGFHPVNRVPPCRGYLNSIPPP